MWTPDDDEFYIGYAAPMPRRLASFVRVVVIAATCAMLTWGVVLAAGHVMLEGGTFEFGHPKAFAGTVVEHPYPTLRLDRPDSTVGPWPLLVARGKHGADALVAGLDGHHATLIGTRIQRGSNTMIEIEPGSISVDDRTDSRAAGSNPLVDRPAHGPVELTGEIVDSKCFLGVMVPGSGTTHKECASLCLRGGIPPAFHVQDRSGNSSLLLMTGTDGEPIGARALDVVGEAVSVTGLVHRQGGWIILRTDPRSWWSVTR
jgi:hypothetical protein